MRFSLAVAVVVVGISISGLAQQNARKAKPSATEKAPRSVALPDKLPATSSTATANQLKAIEQQTARTPATSQSASKKTSAKALPVKPLRDKPAPPMNFGGTGGGKTIGMTGHGANSYNGRLKQKGSGHQ
jgi:hypothetical protein